MDFDTLLRKAVEKGASDLHLKANKPPIVRINGNLYSLLLSDDRHQKPPLLPADQLNAFAQHVLSPQQHARFLQGREVDCGYPLPEGGRFRINICLQEGLPRFVCRYIAEHIRTLEELGLPAILSQLAATPRGLILVTGAAGSGKSTTLAALIDSISRNRSCHVLTIEDPIEFSFKDRRSLVTQREVGRDSESFAMALKYALRQDPDVILVGEMRDEETIQMALQAAETGHLVLSTLHTVDAAETVNRILGAVSNGQGQLRQQLVSVLVAIISQRLLAQRDGKVRVPATEVLVANARVREILADPHRLPELRQVIEESENAGMHSFDQSLLRLVFEGVISRHEARLHCSNAQDFELRLKGVMPGDLAERALPPLPHQAADTNTQAAPSSAKIEIESLTLQQGTPKEKHSGKPGGA